MTDTVDAGLASPSTAAAVQFQFKSYWTDKGHDPLELIPAADEALMLAVDALLLEVAAGARQLQELSNGNAFPDWDGEVDISGRLPNLIGDLTSMAVEPVLPFRFDGDRIWLASAGFPWGDSALLVSEIDLREGSLVSSIKAVFTDRATWVAIFCLAMTTPTEDFNREHRWNAEIQRQISGDPCVTEGVMKISLDTLREVSADAINLTKLDPAAPDYRANVCLLQALLIAAPEVDPGPVDGVPGKMTRQALKAFADRYHWKIDDVRVYRKLVNNVHRRDD